MDYIIFGKKENDEYTAILGTSGEIADDPDNITETEIKLALHLFRGVSYPAVEWTGGLAWVKIEDLRTRATPRQPAPVG